MQQALLLLDQVYVHLPLKRAMHAVDPVQRLRLLRRRSPWLSDRRFHDELLSIFTSLRDIHTAYTGFTHDTFRPGVVVHHWNGMPFDQAVALNADRQPGSNQDARHARGLEAMTIRHLESSLPPDEEWVVVSYTTAEGTDQHLLFTWRIIEPTLGPQGVNPFDADEPAATGLGIDSTTEAVRRAKKLLFAPRAWRPSGPRPCRPPRRSARRRAGPCPPALRGQRIPRPVRVPPRRHALRPLRVHPDRDVRRRRRLLLRQGVPAPARVVAAGRADPRRAG